jgi:Ca2+-binding EF-hand superfamily protein
MSDEADKIFTEFDQDGDGYITAEEFRQAMLRRGEEITDADLESIFHNADDEDGDVDGRISLVEFRNAWDG